MVRKIFVRTAEEFPVNSDGKSYFPRSARYPKTTFWHREMVWRGTVLPSRLFARGSLLSLCLLFVFACDARTALASCGDYLHGHGTPMVGHSGMNADIPDPILGHRTPAPSRPTCSGPHCQRDQQAPAAPSKAIQAPTFNDAILVTISTLVRVDDFGLAPASDADHASGPVGRVFRPPRAA